VLRAPLLPQQTGRCPRCRPVILSSIDEKICSDSIPTVIGRDTMHQTAQRPCRVPHGALGMRERSAGTLARSVLRGPGGCEPT
jgi:hypothetical protein